MAFVPSRQSTVFKLHEHNTSTHIHTVVCTSFKLVMWDNLITVIEIAVNYTASYQSVTEQYSNEKCATLDFVLIVVKCIHDHFCCKSSSSTLTHPGYIYTWVWCVLLCAIIQFDHPAGHKVIRIWICKSFAGCKTITFFFFFFRGVWQILQSSRHAGVVSALSTFDVSRGSGHSIMSWDREMSERRWIEKPVSCKEKSWTLWTPCSIS